MDGLIRRFSPIAGIRSYGLTEAMELTAGDVKVGGYLSEGDQIEQAGVTRKQLPVALLRSGPVAIEHLFVGLPKQGIQKLDLKSRVKHQPLTNNRGGYDKNIKILKRYDIGRHRPAMHRADIIGEHRALEHKTDSFGIAVIVNQRVLEPALHNPSGFPQDLTGIREVFATPEMAQLAMLLA